VCLCCSQYDKVLKLTADAKFGSYFIIIVFIAIIIIIIMITVCFVMHLLYNEVGAFQKSL